jgi:hypothetical protein
VSVRCFSHTLCVRETRGVRAWPVRRARAAAGALSRVVNVMRRIHFSSLCVGVESVHAAVALSAGHAACARGRWQAEFVCHHLLARVEVRGRAHVQQLAPSGSPSRGAPWPCLARRPPPMHTWVRGAWPRARWLAWLLCVERATTLERPACGEIRQPQSMSWLAAARIIEKSM